MDMEEVAEMELLSDCDRDEEALAITDGDTDELFVTDAVREVVGLVVELTDGVGIKFV